jgi:hypothetical protein
MAQNIPAILKKLNSVSFISVTNEEERTLLFIPAWTVAVGVILLAMLRRSRKRSR